MTWIILSSTLNLMDNVVTTLGLHIEVCLDYQLFISFLPLHWKLLFMLPQACHLSSSLRYIDDEEKKFPECLFLIRQPTGALVALVCWCLIGFKCIRWCVPASFVYACLCRLIWLGARYIYMKIVNHRLISILQRDLKNPLPALFCIRLVQ